MKKVGIITVHDIFNYGSIYQALATQVAIERMGYDTELIDYIYPNARHHQATSKVGKRVGHLLHAGNAFLKNRLPGRVHDTYLQRYDSFKQKHYHLSVKRYSSAEALMEAPPIYDTYVAGSDQIWRPKFVNDDPSFFLGFVKEGKRISYASSFGVAQLAEDYKEKYRQYLKYFSEIAVREELGAGIVEDLLGVRPPVVLDPTLLLDSKDWGSYAASTGINEPYLLCYGLHPSNKKMEEFAIEMGSKHSLKVVRANGKFHNYFDRKIHYVMDAGPAECLSLFANATFVMAQSFHATAFSINFRKPFYALLRGDSDHDSRQLNLLEQLNLMNRVRYVDELDSNQHNTLLDLDYTESHKLLDEKRIKSLDYLKQAL